MKEQKRSFFPAWKLWTHLHVISTCNKINTSFSNMFLHVRVCSASEFPELTFGFMINSQQLNHFCTSIKQLTNTSNQTKT